MEWFELGDVTPMTSPTDRTGPAVVYDLGHSEIVLFGGGGNNGALGDTWVLPSMQ